MAEYEDKELTAKVLDKLSKLPPLVQPSEVEALKKLMGMAGRGERFIIQGGDCAERFVDCESERLEAQIKLMLQMGMVHEEITLTAPVCIARIAGQYGKPRSKPTEVVEGHGEIMSYKGDNINGFDPTERKWDPERLLTGYWHSAATLNYLRGLTSSDENLFNLDLDSLGSSKDIDDMKKVAASIKDKTSAPKTFFTSHEAMQLDLEEALTRKAGDKYYNLSAHMVWIGDRTRQLTGAHIEYFRGISNPIGCKVGPSMKDDELIELVKILNPNKEEGRLVLITRYGAGKVEATLPGHIEAVKKSGIPVVWECDAVHGNVITASNKLKTRKVEDILSEITSCMKIHKEKGTILGGVHLEATGQKTVTECLGGCIGITEDGLLKNYETQCDPRMNYSQALETSFNVANECKRQRLS